MSEREIWSVVLAAGRSARMPGRNKLLLSVNGVPVVCRVVEAVREGAQGPVVVVVGYEADAVSAAVEGLGVRTVVHPAYSEGMGTSVAAGVAATSPEAGGILLCPGDLPELPAACVEAVVSRFLATGGSAVAAPVHRGRRGHPVVFPPSFREALLALTGDQGARNLLAGAVLEAVAVDDPGVVRDLDTPDDYRRLGRRP